MVACIKLVAPFSNGFLSFNLKQRNKADREPANQRLPGKWSLELW